MKRREFISPDITPLVDVVFLLLIFFLVSTVFKKEELALMLNLPEESRSAKAVEPENIKIEISKDSYAAEGKRLSFTELERYVAGLQTSDQIQVFIDKSVAYEKVAKILDLLQSHQITQVALAMKS